MKHVQKLTVVLTVAALLITLWAPAAVCAQSAASAAAAAAESTQQDILYVGRELLAPLEDGDKLCHAYDLFIDGIIAGESAIYLDDPLTEEQAQIVTSVVNAILPESYGDYIGHSYSFYSTDSNDQVYIFYSWFYGWGLTEAQKDVVNQRVEELTRDLEGKSDFEKSLLLYQRLVDLNVYDFGTYHQTAYGPLVEGMSVCAGYARAYQLLLHAVGIPCLYVAGTAGGGAHAWNIVQLDGQWYYSDPTWDDSDNLYYGLDYRYFNITYDQIVKEDHLLNAEYLPWVPKSTATDANYYYHEGLVVETLTLSQLINLLGQYNPLQIHITGNRDEVIELFYNNVDTIVAAMGKGGYVTSWCATLGDTYLEVGLALDHAHNYAYLTQEPTCTTGGTTSYACSDCADKGFFYMEPLDHAFSRTWWQDETSHILQCERCDTLDICAEHVYNGGNTCMDCGYSTAPAILNGDANGDGKVNNRDLGLLQRHINGWGDAIDPVACDLNGDGKVNNRDLGLLQRMLNG